LWLLLLLIWAVGTVRSLAQSQPQNLSPGTSSSPGTIVSSSNGRNVPFSWSQTTGTASYQVNVRDVTTDPVNGPLSNFTNNGASSTTITLTLSSRHAYKWNVYACSGVNATGTKILSANAWFRFLNPPYLKSPGNPSSTPPLPKALALTPVIQWDTVPEADGYWFYLSIYPYGPANIIYDTGFGASIYSFQIPAGVLEPGGSYAWNMTSLWGSEESSTLGRALFFSVDTLPTAPNTLSASGGNSAIGLGWNASSANAYGQKLERKDGDNGTWHQIVDLDWNIEGYTDSNVGAGVTYYYRIYAYNGIGNSATNYSTGVSLIPSITLTVSNPNNGQSLQAGGTYTVYFTKSGSTASIDHFDLAYSLNGGNTYPNSIGTNVNNGAIGYDWTVPTCTSTTQGRVRLRAFDGSGNVLASAINPNNFTISAPSGGLPTAKADVTTTSPNVGQYVTFSGNRSLSANSCTPIISYSWTFPDGTYASANPYLIRSFSTSSQSSASFTVTLTVQDSAGNSNIAYLPITVSGWGQGVSGSSSFSHDPVNLANGNYVYEHTDLRVPGKGFPFEFRRFYNSQFSDQTGKPLGYGWTDNYNILLSTAPTNATVTFGDGHSETYYLVNGQYQGAAGVYGILTTNSDGTFTLAEKDQTKQNFNSQGQLVSIMDKNSNTLTLSYNNGALTNITDTAGRQIIFQNDANGRITQISDPIGRSIQFQYDSASNLVAAIDANFGTNIFNYDTNHQMTAAYDARGTRFVTNTYDDLQRIVNYQSDAYTNQSGFYYDFANHVTYVTNAFGKVSIHRHDNNLLVTNIVDEAGNQQFFSYDMNRNHIYIQDKNGNATGYAYDALGNVTNKTDALNNITSIQYDGLNNPTRRADALNNVATFGYDSRGNLTSTTNALGFVSRVQYNASGLPFVLTDARGFSTTNQYDTQGNLIATTDAKSATTHFDYDAVGRKLRQIDALNRTNSFFYDNNDNLTNTVNALGYANTFLYDGNNNRTSSRNPRNAVTTNIFDLKDRLIGVLAPLNQTNGTLYDALDRKIATSDALGNQTGYAYDEVGNSIAVTNALNQITRFTYDSQGNQTSFIDPTGHYVTNFFDALNRKVATIDVSLSTNLTAYDALGRVTTTTNANGQVTQFFYDAIGRLTNVVDSAGQSVFFAYDANGNRTRTTDPNGHTWTNVFDELNRLVEQDNPGTNKIIFHYDPVGNLTNKVTANGDSIIYSYDALNRLTNITYPSGSPVTFAYDSVGNRTNMTDSLGTTARQFDLLNHLTSVTDPYGQTVASGFDANGNRVSLTYPGNKVVNYGFDALNRMTTLTNWLNGVVTYSYDIQGNLIAATNANGTTASYAYDVADRLIALTNAAPDASVIAAYALTLDAVGNHTQATHYQPLFPILPNQTNNYTYDSDNRLATVDGQTVTHNANGDLTGIGTNLYTYDFEDRLVQSSLTNISNTFTYDGLGNRLACTVNEQARHFVLDRMGALTQVLVENDTNNSPVAYYVYGLGLAERISSGGIVATYHFNIQGSTVALTDSGGKITDSYAYDSFGVLANADGDSPQPFGYLGRYGILDDRTGLLYARARYFSPQLGRFLTKDPVTGKDGDSQSLNRYVYALNNPLLFVDISGLASQEGNWLSQFGNAQAGYWSAIIVDPARAVFNFIFHPFQTANSIAYTAKHPGEVFTSVWQNFVGDLSSGDLRRQDHAIGTIMSLFLPTAELKGTTAAVTVDQYALRATEEGWYPVVQRGFSEPQGNAWLNVGDVWKYGTTKNPATRYSQTFLDETGMGLQYGPQFSGTLEEALSAEKNQILDYFNQNGVLPPGNKIIR
jgi:RHS repeat-associated protein